jgi:hypothetical protein
MMCFQNATVDNYCVAYECDGSKWEVSVEVCLCFDQSYIEEINKKALSDLPRCCNETLLTYPVKPKKGGEVMKCPANVDPTRKESLICEDVHFLEKTTFTVTEDSIKIPSTRYQKAIAIPRAEKTQYCLGPTSTTRFDNPLEMTVFYCPNPCEGLTPCIRYVLYPFKILTS